MKKTPPQQPLVPKLRFPEFDNDWRESKIEELFDFKNGLNKEKEFFGRGTPIINFMDVYRLNSIKSENIKGLVELSKSEIERFSAKKGDVFFTRTSETIHDIGMSASLVETIENCVFSGFVLRARPKSNDFIPEFTSYLFSISPIRKEITTKSSMTTRALTSGTLLNKVSFYYPLEHDEQRKIASFLSSVDKKIELLQKKKALLEDYKKGVMQQIFSQQIRFKPTVTASTSEAVSQKEYPDWEERKLKEVFNISAGGDIKKSNVSKFKTKNYIYPIYANSEKNKGLYGYSDIYKIDYECVTVSGRGSLGNAVPRYNKFYPIVRLLILKPLFKLNVSFFAHAINLLNIYNESTGVPQLTAPQLSLYKVKFPLLEEQTKIANFLSAIDSKIELVHNQLENTQAFKKGLLQQLFV